MIKYVANCFSTPRKNYQVLNPLKMYISRIDKEEHHMKITSDNKDYQIS